MKCNFNFFFSGKICGFIIVLTTMLYSLNAQTSPPESISYQGIARDVSGNILSNQAISIQFIIHQGSAGGTSVFTEQHSVTTNSLGLFTLQIGSVNTSAFSSINWANGPYYLEVQMDPNGGTSYISVGTQQMLSVPYALYAKNSYSANYALASYTTANAPPVSITTNTSLTDATITVSQGTNSSSATINFPPAPTPTITITGSGITAVTPTTGSTFTISTPTPTFNNGTNVTVNGTYPSYTISSTPSLSILGNSLSITGGNTVSIPASPVPTITGSGITAVTPSTGSTFTISTPTPTFNNGIGINVTGTYPNYTITNTAPNQTVNIANGTNVTVSGTYPNYTINAAPTLSIVGTNSLSISGGNTVPLPASNVTINATNIVTVSPSSGNNFNIGIPNQTLSINSSTTAYTLTSTHGGTVNLPNPTITVNSPHTQTTTAYNTNINIIPPTILPASGSTANIASVLGNTNTLQYTVNVPPPSLSINTNTTTGVSTLTLTQGAATSTASIPSATNYAWGISGNAGTNPSTNFLGTTDNKDLIFRTNSTERMRISGTTGFVGIGTNNPSYPLHTVYSGFVGAGHYIDYTSTAPSGANSAIYTYAKSTNSGNIFGGYFQVDGSNASNNAIAVKAFATSNANQNYGIDASAVGTTTNTNYGGYFNASNASTSNYGISAIASGTTSSSIYNYGGYFNAQDAAYNYGGYFYTTNGTNNNIAIHANAYSTVSSANNYGIDVYANGTSNNNYGGNFYATGGNINYAIYATINATNAASSSIYAKSIGSNGSAGKFEITNNSNSSPVLHVKNTTTNNPLAIFEGTGFVGIGTTFPQSFLHIQGPNSPQTNILQIGHGNQPNSEWIFDVDATANLRIKNENATSPYLYLGPNSNNIAGINTSTPIGNADFVVSFNGAHSGINYAGMYVNSDASGMPFYGYAKGGSPFAWTYVNSSNNLVFNVGSLDRMYITNSGDVMISNSNAYKYTSPKTYILTIPAYAFNPESPAYSYTTISGNIGPTTGTLTLAAGQSCYFNAPLNLPSNATVTTLQALVYDNSTSYNIGQVQIFQNDYSTSTAYGITTLISPSLATSGINTNLQLISGAVTPSLVINPNYGYWVRVHLPYDTGGNIRLAAVKIVYQVLETD